MGTLGPGVTTTMKYINNGVFFYLRKMTVNEVKDV